MLIIDDLSKTDCCVQLYSDYSTLPSLIHITKRPKQQQTHASNLRVPYSCNQPIYSGCRRSSVVTFSAFKTQTFPSNTSSQPYRSLITLFASTELSLLLSTKHSRFAWNLTSLMKSLYWIYFQTSVIENFQNATFILRPLSGVCISCMRDVSPLSSFTQIMYRIKSYWLQHLFLLPAFYTS